MFRIFTIHATLLQDYFYVIDGYIVSLPMDRW